MYMYLISLIDLDVTGWVNLRWCWIQTERMACLEVQSTGKPIQRQASKSGEPAVDLVEAYDMIIALCAVRNSIMICYCNTVTVYCWKTTSSRCHQRHPFAKRLQCANSSRSCPWKACLCPTLSNASRWIWAFLVQVVEALLEELSVRISSFSCIG